MNPPPLRERIVGALRLAPMTIAELSRCLAARPEYVERLVSQMHVGHVIQHCGSKRTGNYRPHSQWRLAA